MLLNVKKADAVPARRTQRNMPWLSALIPLVALCVLLTLTTPAFLTSSNIANVLRQAAVYAIMAVGMTFVIITGGIDLSQGSVLAVVCIVVGMVPNNGEGSMTLAILAGLLTGAAWGFINGAVIAFVRVPPFIMTLGTMNVARGLALLMTNAAPIEAQYEPFRVMGTGYLLGIPIPVYLFILVGVIGQYVLSKTATGRYIYAVGSNEEAARLSGVKVRLNKIKVYMISGLAVGFAAILYVSRLGSAQPIAGTNYELEAVAATVIGGTSILGGDGGVIGSILGAIVVSVIRNGMVLLEVSTYWQQIAIGIIIVTAVIIDILRKNLVNKR